MCLLISFGLQSQEEISKIYLNSSEILIRPEGILVIHESDYQSVQALYCDEYGIYILSKDYVIRHCTKHPQACSLCGGCDAINCLKKCPRPGRCQ